MSSRYSYSDNFEGSTLVTINEDSHEDSSDPQSRHISSQGKSDYSPSSVTQAFSDYSSSVSDTLSHRSELCDSQFTSSDETGSLYSYSDTFEASAFQSQTAPSDSQFLEKTSQSADDQSVTASKHDTSQSSDYQRESKYLEESFETSPRTSYTSTFEPTDSYSFIHLTEDIKEVTAEDLEAAAAVEAKEEFINQIIGKLRVQKHGQDEPLVWEDKEEDFVPEDKEKKRYCRQKVQQLRRGPQNKKDILSEMKTENKQRQMDPKPVAAYGLNPAILERLKVNSLMECMKKASEAKIHEVMKCRQCRVHKKAMDEAEARRHFVHYQSQRLQSQNMDERIEQHLIKMNTMNLLAEIVRQHPKPTENLDSKEVLYHYQRQLILRRERDLR